MDKMLGRILQLDSNHPLISEQLTAAGFTVEEDHTSSYEEVLTKIAAYDGIIIRSRIPVDRNFLQHATHLKFVARVGAGMENIDVEAAEQLGIALINSPEGNRDALAEQVIGMLLVLMNRLFIASNEVKKGIWRREENRGTELKGKTVGLIGYGTMGKAVAARFAGFGCRVVFHDIRPDLQDENAMQVSLQRLMAESDVISLHVPLNASTHYLVDETFINSLSKPIWFINTSRGKNVNTKDLVEGLKTGKILGAALDVLEYEKPSFENLESDNEDLNYLLHSEKVLITPHIAGWTVESKEKLAQFIVDKILKLYNLS